mmetsp:Transcript_10848/g.15672  ORF Transcript_10848/g.15672 Transcript_10848/m.15672 type:complete len:1081 (-) Transcript_10848:1162-4404(-)
MAKQKRNNKRSHISSLPKGLPIRSSTGIGNGGGVGPSTKKRKDEPAPNPFEGKANKRLKHDVMNRIVPGSKRNPSSATLAKAFQMRQLASNRITGSSKSNAFKDHRIGETQHSAIPMTKEEAMLRRLVKERVSRSKRASKFDLTEDATNQPELTHRGQILDESYYTNKATNSHLPTETQDDADDDLYGATLSRADTELHFGGPSSRRINASTNPYGPTDAHDVTMGDVHRSKKLELEEIIARSKQQKAEKAKQKDEQANTFHTMDEQFSDLAQLLAWNRNKNNRDDDRKKEQNDPESKEMDEWNMEVKEYLFTRKVMATDRTKTPEEIATEQAERLHELERRRMARMNGDFEADDLTDVDLSSSDDEDRGSASRSKLRKKKKKASKKQVLSRNPDELDDSDDDKKDDIQARFTADGLVYIDAEGNVVKKSASESHVASKEEFADESIYSSEDEPSDAECGSEESYGGLGSTDDEASANDISQSDEDTTEEEKTPALIPVGSKVKAKFRANDQFEGCETWQSGTVSKGYQGDHTFIYDIVYDNGDVEMGVEAKNVQVFLNSAHKKGYKGPKDATALKKKMLKAKLQARKSIPFVFDVPTTLDALHDMIAIHAATGADASLIIQRIHTSNSVCLNKNNREKMQNFYDVLLRRFIAVGDAIYRSGDGGEELARYEQLNSLTKTLYKMSQDSAECAGAVWGRRLGVLQKAFAKRLRDSELIGLHDDEDEFSAWPSMGAILLLRACGHIFPVSDFRHAVVTPSLLFLGQIIAQAPVRSIQDVISGLLCSGIMIEYTKDSKRVAPEAISFIAGVICLFAENINAVSGFIPIPTLASAVKNSKVNLLRKQLSQIDADHELPQLSFKKMEDSDPLTAAGILASSLRLVNIIGVKYEGWLHNSEAETFLEITNALLLLKPEKSRLPHALLSLLSSATGVLSKCCKLGQPKAPLRRHAGVKSCDAAVVSLAPRMEDPTRYNLGKDKGKHQLQAQHDKFRREYKREHKAVARELRLDAAFIENDRRKEKLVRDTKAREKRHKNYAWMEQEQATINQQVAQGGALLRGGGIGVARQKAKSARIGIKKGGKLR